MLDGLYEQYNRPDSAPDPIQMVRRWERPEDMEIVAFLSAGLAFGRVESVNQSIARVLEVMGPRPAAYVRSFDPKDTAFPTWYHRWIRGADLAALIWILRQMIEESGSIERFFAQGLDSTDADIGPALERFSAAAMAMEVRSPGVCHFFSRPSGGSACKRLNLFLRWMTRRDAHDLGIWTKVPPAKLVIPLDTHIVRMGKLLRLTRYRTAGWAMAREITASLRCLNPEDPVKYDFALCHLSMAHPRSSMLKAQLTAAQSGAIEKF